MKTLVIIPTYNEKENIENMLQVISNLPVPELSLLIVDDNSPDGTGEIVKKFAEHAKISITLLTRQQKEGLGKAYCAGFAWALAHNFEYVISMDADFSHDPLDIPRLINADKKTAVVLASRYIPGGKIIGWGWERKLNSLGANWFTRLALGLQPHDVTGGFKRYSRKFLESLDFTTIISSGYAFQVEMILHAKLHNFSVQEIPILFVDRRAGYSKISGELVRSARTVFRLMRRRFHTQKPH